MIQMVVNRNPGPVLLIEIHGDGCMTALTMLEPGEMVELPDDVTGEDLARGQGWDWPTVIRDGEDN